MLIDLSSRAKLRVKGTDRVRFLNGQLTNDVTQAQPGTTVHACVLTVKGKLCADLFVTPLPDSFILDCHSDVRGSLFSRLERYLVADDVEIVDETDQLSLFHILNPVIPEAVLPEGTVSRSDRFGSEGRDLLVPVAFKNLVPKLVKESPMEPAAIETLRIERGIPEWGRELSEDVIPNEAGLDESAISYTKGCYLGQEVISRIKSLGHVNRHLCGIQLTEGQELHAGDKLVDPAGRQIGTVTSAIHSAAGNNWIGLAYLKRGFGQPGSRCRVQSANSSDLIGSAEVRSLPVIQE
ncbi:MAG: folate-binding protein YgfZ [Verrucomicrobia bacterium]|nr:folate-binding protein YgfZ [Verrucomicrobiota bacterium]